MYFILCGKNSWLKTGWPGIREVESISAVNMELCYSLLKQARCCSKTSLRLPRQRPLPAAAPADAVRSGGHLLLLLFEWILRWPQSLGWPITRHSKFHDRDSPGACVCDADNVRCAVKESVTITTECSTIPWFPPRLLATNMSQPSSGKNSQEKIREEKK